MEFKGNNFLELLANYRIKVKKRNFSS